MNTFPKHHSSNFLSQNNNPSHNSSRRKHVTFGPYIVGSTLGKGEFGKVKLGWSRKNESTDISKQVAIKLIRRDSILQDREKEIKIYREINALKHLTHPNIVRLEEVLQNSKYIGIVLEYASGGEFYKYIQKKRRLKEPIACKLFAQLVSGVYYMHSKGLVHRDLKLENLLLDKNENLIITDFGFVNEFLQNNELMKTSCGSPCYAAPELVVTSNPYKARKADVWSCGIILFAMLAGYLPWDDDPDNPRGDDIAKLYNYITTSPLKFPSYISAIPRDLLRKILVANPNQRLSLREIETHQWLKPHSSFLKISPKEWDDVMKLKADPSKIRPKLQNYKARPQSALPVSSKYYDAASHSNRGSLVMDSNLLSIPVPPKESPSHVFTKPSSPSTDDKLSPVRNKNKHARSNSAASLALQAFVEAEKEHWNRASIQHNKLHRVATPQNQMPQVTEEDTSPVEKYENYEMLKKKIQPANQTNNNGVNSPVAGQPKRRPRPTTYHLPISASSSMVPDTQEAKLSMINEAAFRYNSGSALSFSHKETSPFDSLSSLAPLGTELLPSTTGNTPESINDTDLKMGQVLHRAKERTELEGSGITVHVQRPEDSTLHVRKRDDGSPVPLENMRNFSDQSIAEYVSLNVPGRTALEKKSQKKRFSLLSFYSSYSSSKSSLFVGNNNSSTNATSKIKNTSRITSSQENKSTQSRHSSSYVTAPSSRQPSFQMATENVNINNENRRPTVRSSMMVGSLSQKNTSDTSEHEVQQENGQLPPIREREPSTARKVIDFFKRRSLRF
ncbi:hypothetical protein KAFR_0A03730 [Kazachstania africana CBS 2517]|uniref:non-specific serine/threonine protein kinase n=1 Tax=Kazachstania africana (strain ATCC 22294 / BCRC 22015 / CBS 2517 / CECT 1963 / NBRC 1671 / NRRL Y-8276) TaxID=1071382 RepID=H2AN58_KAZAF|nr:hypothetical protein KAFR_0A03730 [Kazachstania africana CBS 2517]CCF55808.1 hypothetical protein KAFR_0A03730 [Kazachstania africana CBS 2517]